MTKKHLIIGASAAGITAAVKLRQLDKGAEIICISQEADLPYNKCFLADYMSGVKPFDQLFLRSESFFKDNNIQLNLNTQIIELDPKHKTVTATDGRLFEYDTLLLAMGGSVHFPLIEGIENAKGIFQFYTLQDTVNLFKYAQQESVQNCIIIGAGLSGLESADALLDKVKNITVIEREPHVLFSTIPEIAAQVIQEKMHEHSVRFIPKMTVQKVITEHGVVTSVQLSDGTQLPADMVICALGARPNGWLAQQAGLHVEKGAIVTNEYMQTSDISIYAAGDVAQVTDKLTGQKVKSSAWPDAIQQAMTAACNMAGGEKIYDGVATVISSAFFGMKFHACGQLKNALSDNTELRKNSEQFRLTVTKNGALKGFLLLGSAHGLSELRRSL